jgi:hypothetical protein
MASLDNGSGQLLFNNLGITGMDGISIDQILLYGGLACLLVAGILGEL